MTAVMTRYLNLKEAAGYLALSERCIYEWALKGEIPAHKLGRVWCFDIDELDEWVHRPR